MGKPDLGVKQTCPNCEARFFDLNKRPASCPKCKTQFDPDTHKPSRRAAAVKEPELEEVEDEAADDAEDDVPAVDSPKVAVVAPVSGSDDDGDDDVIEDEEELTEEVVEEEAETIEGDAGDVPFLEDDDDDDEFEDEFDDDDDEDP